MLVCVGVPKYCEVLHSSRKATRKWRLETCSNGCCYVSRQRWSFSRLCMRRLAGSLESNSHVLIRTCAVARYILTYQIHITQFRSALFECSNEVIPISCTSNRKLDSQAKFKATVLGGDAHWVHESWTKAFPKDGDLPCSLTMRSHRRATKAYIKDR